MPRRSIVFLGLCITASLGLSGAVLLVRLFFPFGLDYGEAPLVDQARRLWTGISIYPLPAAAPPYVISNYPPIFPALAGLLTVPFGLPPFQSGRAISLAAALITTGVIAALGTQTAGNRLAGWGAAALFLAHPFVTLWASLARVDMLALCLSLLGLWLVYRKQTPANLLLAGGCLLAAAFTRQSNLLAAPLAAVIWLWSQRSRAGMRWAWLVFGGGLLLAGAAFFAALNAATQGGAYFHIVTANLNEFNPLRAANGVWALLITWPIALFLALFGAMRGSVPCPAVRHLWLPYALASFGTALTIGKVGSNLNYLLEWMAAAALLAGAALREQENSRQPAVSRVLAGVQLAWLLAGAAVLYPSTTLEPWKNIEMYRQRTALVKSVAGQGPVLSDDFLDAVVSAGQGVYYQPFEYGQLFLAGCWSASDLAAQASAARFPLILIGETLDKVCCWPPEVRAAIRERYDVEQADGYLIYRPKE
jgi:hypothetical protein